MISVKIFEAPAWDVREILRYARADGDEPTLALIDECIREAEPVLSYKVCYTVSDIIRSGGVMDVCGLHTASGTLCKALSGCDRAVLFAATVGTPFDRLIAKYSRVSPAKALILQAIGAERAEALCDAFQQSMCDGGMSMAPRVSPGYGDIPLEMQRDIFAVLDCPRKIGLTLNESLIMSPSKSVTAIAGIKDGAPAEHEQKCSSCYKTDCIYRK